MVETIARREGADPSDLPPLYDAVDTDALDRLAGPRGAGTGDVEVTFAYQGYRVTVRGDGRVSLAGVERPGP